MSLDFLTPEVFDVLIIAVIVIGLAFAVWRLYTDFTRPLGPERPPLPVDAPPVDPAEPTDREAEARALIELVRQRRADASAAQNTDTAAGPNPAEPHPDDPDSRTQP
ncbi:MAG: hypothetical protein GYB67_03765 [Chloroflexi bacterium]|nr:hypothetical protein [Chloroflexota bacterium]